MIEYLLGKASTGKFRWWCIEWDENNYEEGLGYALVRTYGQVHGKVTEAPIIYVPHGKAKRTTKEQATLQFNSEVKKQLDKGYVKVDKHPNEYSESELKDIFGDVVTNQVGCIKPMLAKQESKLTNRKVLDKEWLCSAKYDGVRCLMYWDGKEVRTASRGGEHYDYSTSHIREREDLIKFFENNSSIILDGELYKHGKTLQQISGAARMEKNAYDCDWLEYHVYDMYNKTNPEMTAKERIHFIQNDFVDSLEPNDIIHIVNHFKISGESVIWDFHNQFVEEGFEGCVIRNPDKPYKPNGRTNDMLKFKQYKSEDFKVIGYELGTRGSEDMTFVCELPDGRTFKAMPVGDRATKEEYVENFESKYNGHMAECTYFNYSDEGIPTQPKLRIFRFDLE